jgi:hypothetical protein
LPSQNRGAHPAGDTPTPARRRGGRIGAECGLDGGSHELRGLRVDGDVAAQQHAADDLPGVLRCVREAVSHVGPLS